MPEPSHIADALAAYRKDGYAVLRGVFSAAEVAEIAAAFDRHYARGLELGFHVGQRELGGLKVGDRLAELLAVLGVCNRLVEAGTYRVRLDESRERIVLESGDRTHVLTAFFRRAKTKVQGAIDAAVETSGDGRATIVVRLASGSEWIFTRLMLSAPRRLTMYTRPSYQRTRAS